MVMAVVMMLVMTMVTPALSASVAAKFYDPSNPNRSQFRQSLTSKVQKV
jgi:ABC-type transport system involved in cytochrome bd biosynthesis fused ATPase/permease subunit